MKRQDSLCMREGGDDLGTVLLLCHLLQTVQILQTSLKIGQTATQNRLSLWHLQQVEKRDTGKEFGLDCCLLRPKIAQIHLQHLVPALRQFIEMPVGFAFLLDDLPGYYAHLFKALEDQVERFVVEG